MAEWERKLDHHMRHRLSFKTFFKEVYAHFTDKVIPHGADELGNALHSAGHSGYLPWPGSSGPAPVEAPAMPPEEPEPNSFDKHAALYGVSYDDHLDHAATRGGNDDKGFTR